VIKFGQLTSLRTSVPTPGKTPQNRSLKEQINAVKVQRQLEGTKQQSELCFDQSTSSDGLMQCACNIAAALQIG